MLDVHLRAEPAAVGEIELGEIEVQPSLLPETVEAVIAAIVGVRDPFFDPRNAGEALFPHQARFVIAIPTGPVEESDLWIEFAAHLDIAGDIAPPLGFIAEPRAVRDVV